MFSNISVVFKVLNSYVTLMVTFSMVAKISANASALNKNFSLIWKTRNQK